MKGRSRSVPGSLGPLAYTARAIAAILVMNGSHRVWLYTLVPGFGGPARRPRHSSRPAGNLDATGRAAATPDQSGRCGIGDDVRHCGAGRGLGSHHARPATASVRAEPVHHLLRGSQGVGIRPGRRSYPGGLGDLPGVQCADPPGRRPRVTHEDGQYRLSARREHPRHWSSIGPIVTG